jgi:uncharacterized protein (TIGR01319 family)
LTDTRPLLLADIGSTFTKVALVDPSDGSVRAMGAAPTTVETDVNEGFDAACATAGVTVDDARDVRVCSSAAGGLKIAAVGLMPELTAKAAQLAALGAGGKVVGTFSHRLNDVDIERMNALAPDIVLLAGGTDGGNHKYLVGNSKRLQSECPEIAVIVAGNRDAYDDVRSIFGDRGDVYYTDNVMPVFGELVLDPARERIRDVFLDRIVHAKGLDRLQSRARILMPTPEAVLRATVLLSRGCEAEPGLGELMVVDMGGATTDVYSCADGSPKSLNAMQKGLAEPHDKRTVEADIGMSHTLPYLCEQIEREGEHDAPDVTTSEVRAWLDAVSADPSRCAESESEHRVVTHAARAGCRIAVARHCGRLEETFTPDGRMFLQFGKDLTEVKLVIGSGGAISRARDPHGVLAGAAERTDATNLIPRDPGYSVDAAHILWAAGLLAEDQPLGAFLLMKSSIVEATRAA